MKKTILYLCTLLCIVSGCAKKQQSTTNTENVDVTKIYNVVILDRSGSMNPLREAAIQGYNETIEIVRKAQQEHDQEQQNLISLTLFNQKVTNVFDCDVVEDVTELLFDNYVPNGKTAMLDAIGISLTNLQKQLDQLENATAVVTIISDGLENASTKYRLPQLVELIDTLKEQGVMFVFMGTNQNVEMTATALHIEEYKVFDYSSEGMTDAWHRGIEASERYYERMAQINKDTRGMSKKERNSVLQQRNRENGYFNNER